MPCPGVVNQRDGFIASTVATSRPARLVRVESQRAASSGVLGAPQFPARFNLNGALRVHPRSSRAIFLRFPRPERRRQWPGDFSFSRAADYTWDQIIRSAKIKINYR